MVGRQHRRRVRQHQQHRRQVHLVTSWLRLLVRLRVQQWCIQEGAEARLWLRRRRRVVRLVGRVWRRLMLLRLLSRSRMGGILGTMRQG